MESAPIPRYRFRERQGRLDLRKLDGIDVERVLEEHDLSQLQTYLNDLVFCRLAEEDIQAVSDEHLVRFFQLCQFTIEYLMHSQDSLLNHIRKAQSKRQQIETQVDEFKALFAKRDEDIKYLRREIHQKRKTVRLYEGMLRRAGIACGGTVEHVDSEDRTLELIKLAVGTQQQAPTPAPAPIIQQSGADPEALRALERRLEAMAQELRDNAQDFQRGQRKQDDDLDGERRTVIELRRAVDELRSALDSRPTVNVSREDILREVRLEMKEQLANQQTAMREDMDAWKVGVMQECFVLVVRTVPLQLADRRFRTMP